jgi:hypothetical protein
MGVMGVRRKSVALPGILKELGIFREGGDFVHMECRVVRDVWTGWWIS